MPRTSAWAAFAYIFIFIFIFSEPPPGPSRRRRAEGKPLHVGVPSAVRLGGDLGLRLVQRGVDVAVEDAAGPLAVDVALPGADHDRGHALPIMLVSARPMPMNQSTASISTRPTTGMVGDRGERRRQDDDGRARDAVRALGGDERHAEDRQQVADRERRVGRLGDEDGGQRQVDREAVEVERVAGRDDEADGATRRRRAARACA